MRAVRLQSLLLESEVESLLSTVNTTLLPEQHAAWEVVSTKEDIRSLFISCVQCKQLLYRMQDFDHLGEDIKSQFVDAFGQIEQSIQQLHDSESREEFLKIENSLDQIFLSFIVSGLDFSTPRDSAIFWTGYGIRNNDFAKAIAASKKGTTIELTKGGIILDTLQFYDSANSRMQTISESLKDNLFGEASRKFAEGAQGLVRCIVYDCYNKDSIYARIEKPILEQKEARGEVTIEEKQIDPNTSHPLLDRIEQLSELLRVTLNLDTSFDLIERGVKQRESRIQEISNCIPHLSILSKILIGKIFCEDIWNEYQSKVPRTKEELISRMKEYLHGPEYSFIYAVLLFAVGMNELSPNMKIAVFPPVSINSHTQSEPQYYKDLKEALKLLMSNSFTDALLEDSTLNIFSQVMEIFFILEEKCATEGNLHDYYVAIDDFYHGKMNLSEWNLDDSLNIIITIMKSVLLFSKIVNDYHQILLPVQKGMEIIQNNYLAHLIKLLTPWNPSRKSDREMSELIKLVLNGSTVATSKLESLITDTDSTSRRDQQQWQAANQAHISNLQDTVRKQMANDREDYQKSVSRTDFLLAKIQKKLDLLFGQGTLTPPSDEMQRLFLQMKKAKSSFTSHNSRYRESLLLSSLSSLTDFEVAEEITKYAEVHAQNCRHQRIEKNLSRVNNEEVIEKQTKKTTKEQIKLEKREIFLVLSQFLSSRKEDLLKYFALKEQLQTCINHIIRLEELQSYSFGKEWSTLSCFCGDTFIDRKYRGFRVDNRWKEENVKRYRQQSEATIRSTLQACLAEKPKLEIEITTLKNSLLMVFAYTRPGFAMKETIIQYLDGKTFHEGILRSAREEFITALHEAALASAEYRIFQNMKDNEPFPYQDWRRLVWNWSTNDKEPFPTRIHVS